LPPKLRSCGASARLAALAPAMPLHCSAGGGPGAVGYYLRAHGVPPEPELATHIRASGFRVPEVADEIRSAAVAVITGSS
jgi:hypothetical protein